MKKSQFMIITIIILYSLISCNLLNDDDLLYLSCTHPWIVVGFDAESIGTTTGKVDTWNYKKQGGENEVILFPLGIDTFDRIAYDYNFDRMTHMYNSNDYPEWLLSIYGVYPLNVFLIESGLSFAGFYTSDFPLAMKELNKDENILYVNYISCSKTKCSDNITLHNKKGK